MDEPCIKAIDLNNDSCIKEILSVQIPSYRVEAELIGYYEIPPLKDTSETIKISGESFFGYYTDNKLVGLISYKLLGNTLDIYRMAVDPKFFRKGIASKLLSYIEKLYSETDKAIVSTGSKNLPAKLLYLNNGFVVLGEREVASGIYITMFEKTLSMK